MGLSDETLGLARFESGSRASRRDVCLRRRVSVMDLEAKIGQLFFVGFDGTEDSADLRDYLADVRPGGVILFARNIVDAPQLRALNAAVREALDPPPFIAVD